MFTDLYDQLINLLDTDTQSRHDQCSITRIDLDFDITEGLYLSGDTHDRFLQLNENNNPSHSFCAI